MWGVTDSDNHGQSHSMLPAPSSTVVLSNPVLLNRFLLLDDARRKLVGIGSQKGVGEIRIFHCSTIIKGNVELFTILKNVLDTFSYSLAGIS